MSFIDELDLKRRFLSGDGVGERMITHLIALISTTPQPLEFVKRVMDVAKHFSKQYGFNVTEYKDAKLPDEMIVWNARFVIESIRGTQRLASGLRTDHFVFKNFDTFAAGVDAEVSRRENELLVPRKNTGSSKKDAGVNNTYEQIRLEEYKNAALHLCFMEPFQEMLQKLRNFLGIKPYFPASIEDVRFLSPYDVLYGRLTEEAHDMERVIPTAFDWIRRICFETGLDFEYDRGLVIAMLCFGAQPRDFFADTHQSGRKLSKRMEMVIYLATQRVITAADKLHVFHDDTSLIGGLLLALAHVSSPNKDSSELPESVVHWIRCAQDLCELLNVAPGDSSSVTKAMTEVGGNLVDMRAAEPRLYVEIRPGMSKDELKLLREIAISTEILARGKSTLTKSEVTKPKSPPWLSFERDITFWEYYSEAQGDSDDGKIKNAINAYNAEREKFKLDNIFPSNQIGINLKFARPIIRKLEAYRTARKL